MSVDFETVFRELIKTDNVAEVASFIKSYCKNGKCVTLPHDNKCSLIITYGCDDAADVDYRNAIMFSGHFDVVGVNKEKWDTDPFELVKKDGFYYGRGVVDMKGAVASVIYTLENTKVFKQPVVLALTADEETGMQGIEELCNYLDTHNIKPKCCFVCEASNDGVGVGNNGDISYETVCYGKSCHASHPENGENAIYKAMDFIASLKSFGELQSDSVYNVGKIEGGTVANIVPNRCAVTWEFRSMDNEKVKLLKEWLPDEPYLEHRLICDLKPFKNNDFAKFKPYFSENINQVIFSGTTEAGYFQAIGIDTVIYGPGDLAEAHSDNEKVKVTDIENFITWLERVV